MLNCALPRNPSETYVFDLGTSIASRNIEDQNPVAVEDSSPRSRLLRMMPNRTQLGVEVPRGIEPSGVLRPGGHFFWTGGLAQIVGYDL